MLDFMFATPKKHILGRNGVFWRILRQDPSRALGCIELQEPKKTNTFWCANAAKSRMHGNDTPGDLKLKLELGTWNTSAVIPNFYFFSLHLSLPGSSRRVRMGLFFAAQPVRPATEGLSLTFACAEALPLFSLRPLYVFSGFARGVRNRVSICSPLRSFQISSGFRSYLSIQRQDCVLLGGCESLSFAFSAARFTVKLNCAYMYLQTQPNANHQRDFACYSHWGSIIASQNRSG